MYYFHNQRGWIYNKLTTHGLITYSGKMHTNVTRFKISRKLKCMKYPSFQLCNVDDVKIIVSNRLKLICQS